MFTFFSQLILTLKTCWEDLSGFLGIFFLVFFAFVQMFYMILQTHMEEFRSITAAFSTCFTMLLNKFKFGSLKETSTTAAVMFFFFAGLFTNQNIKNVGRKLIFLFSQYPAHGFY